MTANRHGLKRDIPPAIKREVRQRDGFGCVVCGSALIDYDHFCPPFADATEHNVNGIILLCVSCHRKKGSFISLESIREAASAPMCKRLGFSFGPFDVGHGHPEIHFGKTRMRQIFKIINIYGEDVFSIDPPEQAGGPFLVSADIRDANGLQTLLILENEWRTAATNWDVEVVGPRITIRQKIGDIQIRLLSVPPKILVFERLVLCHRNVRLSVGADQDLVVDIGGAKSGGSAEIIGFRAGIVIDEEGLTFGSGGAGMVLLHDFTFNSSPDPESHVTMPDKEDIDSAGFASGFRRSGLAKRPGSRQTPRRNDLCDCGSGLRFKRFDGRII